MSDYVSDGNWIDGESQEEVLNVFSTEKVEEYLIAMEEGRKMPGVKSPFHDGKTYLRKGNLVFEYTDEELYELTRCATDIVYFAEKFATVMTDDGLMQVKMRDYQKEILKNCDDNRFFILLAARQIGKTITASIYLAHYLIFNYDRNAMLLANKADTTKEIIDKCKVILENLPFFMKPGILKYDVMNMKFDNGCRLQGQSTTGKAAIGFTVHLLFLDEFAHVPHKIVNSFYENIYPTLSSSKVSRIIITSTQNGFNKFQQIYTGAARGENEFFAQKVDWWQVPGRDDEWYEREVKNLGSVEAFNRQYGTSFVNGEKLLLEPSTIKRLQKNQVQYEEWELPQWEDWGLSVDKHFRKHPEWNPYDINKKDERFLFSIDVAEGNGGDYSVVQIFQVVMMTEEEMRNYPNASNDKEFFKLVQKAVFQSNEHSIEDFAKIIVLLIHHIFDSEDLRIVLEWNTYGAYMMQYLQSVLPKVNDFEEESVLKFKHSMVDKGAGRYGLRLKSDNKTAICQEFEGYIRKKRIELTDIQTIEELLHFGVLFNGSYGGQMGHDDLAMSAITSSQLFNNRGFNDVYDDLMDVYNERLRIVDELLENSDDDMNFDVYDLL